MNEGEGSGPISVEKVSAAWKMDSKHLQDVRKKKTLIFDEVFVRPSEFWQSLETIISLACTSMDSEASKLSLYSFSGKQVIFCGDPLQMLAFEASQHDPCTQLVSSGFLDNFSAVHLVEQMRQLHTAEGKELQKVLGELRLGRLDLSPSSIKRYSNWGCDVDAALAAEEGDFKVTYIYAKNTDVDQHNLRTTEKHKQKRGTVIVQLAPPAKKTTWKNVKNSTLRKWSKRATTLIPGMPER